MKISFVSKICALLLVVGFSSFSHAESVDPNLKSYMKSGECSDIESANGCTECPLHKKNVTLPQNSSFMKAENIELEDINSAKPAKPVEGVE